MDDKYKRQKDYNERLKEQGLVKTTVWIPPRFRSELIAIAAEMREEERLDESTDSKFD